TSSRAAEYPVGLIALPNTVGWTCPGIKIKMRPIVTLSAWAPVSRNGAPGLKNTQYLAYKSQLYFQGPQQVYFCFRNVKRHILVHTALLTAPILKQMRDAIKTISILQWRTKAQKPPYAQFYLRQISQNTKKKKMFMHTDFAFHVCTLLIGSFQTCLLKSALPQKCA
uniref:Uncharacterized protein n=1 Tax=Hippocampus comes TaxID=109280 RepID=A0A3Q2YR41_HIPCM